MGRPRNWLLVLAFSAGLGAVCGAAVWLFLRALSFSLELLWVLVPSALEIPAYPLLICALGGLLIGWFHRRHGAYPESMEAVLHHVKHDGGYDHRKFPVYAVGALLPLMFGASVGPEAGLVGVIAALCSFAKSRFVRLRDSFSEVVDAGFAAALAVVFGSPLFGIAMPLEHDGAAVPRRRKMVLYFMTILGALGAFWLLGQLVGVAPAGLPQIPGYAAGWLEWLTALPLAAVGYLLGLWYLIADRLLARAFGRVRPRPVVFGLLGGVILGLCGMWLPLTMFSGEEQLHELVAHWGVIGAATLAGTAVVKLALTALCVRSGLTGGHFFPAIFAGVAAGYAVSLLTGVNPAFACAAVTAALLGAVLRKPLAAALLLLLVFPITAVPLLLGAAALGAAIPIPHVSDRHGPARDDAGSVLQLQ